MAWDNPLSKDANQPSVASILPPSKLTSAGRDIKVNKDPITPIRGRSGERADTPAEALNATASTAAIFGTT
jgi:hypothetical protein